MPPNRPLGGPPPLPPNRADRRVSSFWMRCHASFGSGADIIAVSGGVFDAVFEDVQAATKRTDVVMRSREKRRRIATADARRVQVPPVYLRAFRRAVLLG